MISRYSYYIYNSLLMYIRVNEECVSSTLKIFAASIQAYTILRKYVNCARTNTN